MSFHQIIVDHWQVITLSVTVLIGFMPDIRKMVSHIRSLKKRAMKYRLRVTLEIVHYNDQE